MNPVLTKIQATVASREQRTPYPEWKDSDLTCERRLTHGSLAECFAANFSAVNGTPMQSITEVAGFLAENNCSHGYCDPQLAESIGAKLGDDISITTHYNETRYDDYQFGITRATGAIAESGTLILRDTETSCRLGALTPWVHVAVLDKASIHRTIGDAIAAFGDDPNIIWITGPSKTADVEGILIEGVHGPGVQIALML